MSLASFLTCQGFPASSIFLSVKQQKDTTNKQIQDVLIPSPQRRPASKALYFLLGHLVIVTHLLALISFPRKNLPEIKEIVLGIRFIRYLNTYN